MPSSGWLSFAEGVTESSITVAVINDDEPEKEETFSVTFGDASAEEVILGDVTSTLVIVAKNDDIEGVIGFVTPDDW